MSSTRRHPKLRRFILLPLALLLAGIAFSAMPAGAASGDGFADDDEIVPNRYIVTMRDGVQADGYATLLNLRQDAIVIHTYHDAMQGFAGAFSPDVIEALLDDPYVLSVEPDRLVTTLDQSIPTGITRTGAEENANAGIDGIDNKPDIDIAVIDTGVDIDHPDLRVTGGFASYASTFGNWVLCGYYTSSWDDGHGHGTHVSGTIAARDNDIGVVGMVPGARIWAVRVLSPSGSGCMSDVIAGVDWVTANADIIEVANMSLAGGNSAALCTAIANSIDAGVFYAVAAGNSGTDAANSSPANCAGATTVSAIVDTDGAPGGLGGSTGWGADDTFASFSSYGSVVDIAAPGVFIVSTVPGGGLGTSSGTSMASPHVAGAAALHILKNGGPENDSGVAAVKAALLAAAAPQESAWGASGDPDNLHEPILCVGTTCAGGSPAATPVPTDTPAPTPVPQMATNTPTDTPTPTPTPVPPTATSTPTDTPVPPRATNSPTPTSTPPTATVRTCFDVDGDGVVGLLTDILSVATALGSQVGDPRYDVMYDIDGDGTISLLADLLPVMQHYGQDCSLLV